MSLRLRYPGFVEVGDRVLGPDTASGLYRAVNADYDCERNQTVVEVRPLTMDERAVEIPIMIEKQRIHARVQRLFVGTGR